MNKVDIVEQSRLRDDIPEFWPGDTVKVHLIKRAPIPSGMRIPLVVSGPGGKFETFLVDPKTRPVLKVPFEIRRIDWDPERTVPARVR